MNDRDVLDYIEVAGVVSPGVVKISGHSRKIGWKIQEADGQNGASTTRQGKKVSSFTATFYLADDDERLEWDEFQKLLDQFVEKDPPVAADVSHPDLLRNGIQAVQVEEIGGMDHDGKGGSTVVVKFLEYKPPKPKSSSKSSGSVSDDTETKYDPNAEAKKTLDDLLTQAEAP